MQNKTKCPVCSSKNIVRKLIAHSSHGRVDISSKEKFIYQACTDCEAIFLNPSYIGRDFFAKYYNQEIYAHRNGWLRWIEKQLETFSFKKKVEIILRHFKLKSKVSILDVGCGNGAFLSSIDNPKFIKEGIEIDESYVAIWKEKKLNINVGNVLNFDFKDKKYDVITLWHVLEHIELPNKLFFKLRNLLKKDGIIILAMPNADSLGFKKTSTGWFHLDAPRHVILYTPKTLGKLASNNNLHIRRTINEFYDYPLDLFWSLSKKSNNLIPIIFYPLIKIKAKETLTYVIQ